VVIEFARGGPDRSALPLPAPLGYRYSFATLSEAILSRASVLYVWVTPEESRRKNIERTDPNDPGSILHHGVPMAVMLATTAATTMEWLLQQSDRPDTVRVEAHGRTWHLRSGASTTAWTRPRSCGATARKWKETDVAALHSGWPERSPGW